MCACAAFFGQVFGVPVNHSAEYEKTKGVLGGAVPEIELVGLNPAATIPEARLFLAFHQSSSTLYRKFFRQREAHRASSILSLAV